MRPADTLMLMALTQAPSEAESDHLATSLTVIIPTRNRAALLRECLDSVLAQRLPDGLSVAIEIHDNASTDETPEVVAAIDDARLRYIRRPKNVGLFGNWHRALSGVETEYVALLQDDDLWHPEFVAQLLGALERSPSAGFASCDIEEIDERGQPIMMRSINLDAGLNPGLSYLRRIVDGQHVRIDMSVTMIRTAAFRDAGGLVARHQLHDIVYNLQFRIAEHHDVVHVPETLASIRLHDGQAHRTVHADGAALGMVADRMDAAAMLLRTDPSFADSSQRAWLAERLITLGGLRSQFTNDDMPSLGGTWDDRAAVLADLLVRALPEVATVLWTTDDLLYAVTAPKWTNRFVIEIDGECGGTPHESTDAVAAFDAMLEQGVEYLVVPWPSFWWLDFYAGLRHRLEEFPRIVDDGVAIVFRLTGDHPGR